MTTTTTTTTLAARAASLLTKQAAYAAAEKALDQALTARRVYPPMAQDFGEQLGHDLPLKTKDFVKVVGHLLAASEKPIKGAVSKKKSDILGVLAELVGALTDTAPIPLPEWAIAKTRAKKAEAEAEAISVDGALDRANAADAANDAAEALASTAAQEAIAADIAARAAKVTVQEVNDAVACILAHVDVLTEAQREMLRAALASTELAPF